MPGRVPVGAKLNHVGAEPIGEGGVTMVEHAGSLPNDEFALYNEGDFRLRECRPDRRRGGGRRLGGCGGSSAEDGPLSWAH